MKKRPTVMRCTARTRDAWRNLMKQMALAEGIPESYRQVLMFLHHHPGAGQRSIATSADVTASAVNQVVKSMLEEGYLRKEPDPADKRGCKLYLTDKGETVSARLRRRIDEADDAITAHIGAETEAKMIALLDDLAKFIREGLAEC